MAQNVRSVVSLLAIGILAWLVAGVIAVAVQAESKIVWTCLSGALLGLIGIAYTIRRARKSGI